MHNEIKALSQRVADLEKEVASLKHQLAEQSVKSKATKPLLQQKATIQEPTRVKEKEVLPREQTEWHVKEEAPVKSTPKKEVNLEKQLGVWLPRIFMFILLLGVLWGLKVGMDHGLISNPVRIALGYIGTAILYYIGMRSIEQGKKLFGLTLLGGFIVLGILTTFAAHYLYGYFSLFVAFTIGILYIVAGLYLSKKTASETLTIFSAIAGFLLPFLLEGEGATAIQFSAYILLLFLSLFYISISQKHKYSFYVTFLLFHLTMFVYTWIEMDVGEENIVVITIILQHISLLLFYINGHISKQIFTESLIYTNVLFTILWIMILDYPQNMMTYGILALLYVVLAINTFIKKLTDLQGVLSAVALFTVSVFILSFNLEDAQIKLIFLLINGTVGLWVGLRYKTVRTIVASSFIYGLTVFFIINIVGMETFLSLEHAVWFMMLLTMIVNYYTLYQFVPTYKRGNIQSVDKGLIVGQFISLIYLIKLTNLWTMEIESLDSTVIHIHILVLIIALVLMYNFHKWRHGKYLTHAVVIEFLILGLVVITTSTYDYYEQEWFVFNLVVQMIYVSILTALFIAVIKSKFYVVNEAMIKKIPTLAVIMQIIYFIFLNKWYFAITNEYSWDDEYVLFMHTFLLFLFAFISISVGGKMKWKTVIVIGVGLIVFSLLKLFIVDLANISILIRAVLFTIVGIVGLLYSRTLVKDGEK